MSAPCNGKYLQVGPLSKNGLQVGAQAQLWKWTNETV